MHCEFRPGDRVRIKSKEKQSKGHGFTKNMGCFCGRTATLEEICIKEGPWSDGTFTEEIRIKEGPWSDGAFTVKLNFDDKSPGDDTGWNTPDIWGWSTSMIEFAEPLTEVFSTRASNEIRW